MRIKTRNKLEIFHILKKLEILEYVFDRIHLWGYIKTEEREFFSDDFWRMLKKDKRNSKTFLIEGYFTPLEFVRYEKEILRLFNKGNFVLNLVFKNGRRRR